MFYCQLKYDLGRDEELLLSGKSGIDGLRAHNARHQLGYAGIYKIYLYVWPKKWLICSNKGQMLGKIDDMAVHGTCCNMTNK